MPDLKRTKTSDGVKKQGNRYFDYSLLFIMIFTILFGYVILYSASSYSSKDMYGDSLYQLKKQLLATAIGVVGFIAVMLIDYTRFKQWARYIYVAAICTIPLVWTPLGIEVNGAKRWVNLGFIQFQPAELVKIAVILYMAAMLSNCKEGSLRNPKTCWQIFARALVPAAALYLCTSNMSSAIIVVLIGVIMMIVAGARGKFIKHLGIISGVGAAIFALVALLGGTSFRINRVLVWLNPEQYSDTTGYQVMQGLYAIGSGRFFGKGLGNSAQKLGTLPESTNDMIFAIICEELGLFGAICVIALFVFMILRMRTIANHVPRNDMFGSMIVVGIMAHIATQVVLNIAVVTNTMPNTGVSLPFISYGGTSLAFLITEMGFVFSVSRSIGRQRRRVVKKNAKEA